MTERQPAPEAIKTAGPAETGQPWQQACTAISRSIKDLRTHLDNQFRQLGALMSNVQGDIAAQTSTLNQIAAALPGISTALDDLVAEVNALKTANPGLDVSGLDAAVSALGTAASTLEQHASTVDPGAQPAPPAPAPGA